MINVPKDHLDDLKALLRAHLPTGVEVFVFGSRIHGKNREYSDIDLLVKGEAALDWRKLETVKTAIAESDIPFMVDIVDWHQASEEFRGIVDKDKEQLLP